MKKTVYCIILTILVCASTLSASLLTPKTYYVDDSNGNDNWSGTSPVYLGSGVGPVKTIKKGIQYADDGDIVIVADGLYFGKENLELYFYDDVKLKSADGPGNCVINFYGDDYRWSFNDNVNTSISGFSIRGIKYESIIINEQNKIEFENCIFEKNILYNDNSLIKCNQEGSLKLKSCIFRDNVFNQGSLIKCRILSSLEIYNCTITENESYDTFIAINLTSDANSIVENTNITNNVGYNALKAIICADHNVTINKCKIADNLSFGITKGIYCYGTVATTISDSDISDNDAQDYTHGIYVAGKDTKLKIKNCTINNNKAFNEGYDSAGIHIEDCNLLEITNCLITKNKSMGIHNYYSDHDTVIQITNCTVADNDYGIKGNGSPINVHNCVVAGNLWDQLEYKGFVVTYSDISDNTDHIFPGIGNINADPLFADPNKSDYHLLSEAGRYDPVDQQWVRDDNTSPCIDAGDPANWVDDEPAGNGGRINMGYYGGTAQASKTDFCTSVMPGDINRDCVVNFTDFALMTSDWLNSTIEKP